MTVEDLMDKLADQPPDAEVEIVFDSESASDSVGSVCYRLADLTRPSAVQIVGEH